MARKEEKVMKINFENNANVFKQEMGNRGNKIAIALGTKIVSVWQKIITAKKVVDTGRFRNSTQWYADKNKVVIGSPLSYSIFLENGTSRQPARPTLKPAIMDYREDYEKLIEQILKD